ncbi:ALPHA/BETA-HYDROLASES SUPERFAMILY PROTEIN [Salix koriyanagi]|uniref:ALPHA/BETA-HYDROLASES SUPERFAMILY PROTEIN n=1 Tax=Salix koriyanagi TaxID=2511006 RepID=A0A9Q0UEM3_9ROSI|nr:ALPHA/BETA-HYDROLASES SUPERFAMILY PROTEIN [Salix koriyanagi]
MKQKSTFGAILQRMSTTNNKGSKLHGHLTHHQEVSLYSQDHGSQSPPILLLASCAWFMVMETISAGLFSPRLSSSHRWVFACFGLDIEGHGKSQGLKGFVPNVDLVVQDCLSFFDSIKNDTQFNGLPFFLYGESMGGAICLLIHLASPKGFDGAVLVAPMCKISDNIKPRWPIPDILLFVAKFMPTLAIVPAASILHKSIKVESKVPIAEMNPGEIQGETKIGNCCGAAKGY